MSFNPPVYLLPKRIPDHICDQIIEYGKTKQNTLGTTGDDKLSDDKEYLEDLHKRRKSNVSWFRSEAWIAKWVCEGAMGICQHVGWETVRPEPIQFTIYNAPDGHYGWHTDQFDPDHEDMKSDDIQGRQRKVSIVCNITDPSEYDGGDLEIIDPMIAPDEPEDRRIIKISKERGQLVVFPSFFWHRVKPITRGTRYSVVCWLRGPEWR
jgi:PKHD-type hydroxylase